MVRGLLSVLLLGLFTSAATASTVRIDVAGQGHATVSGQAVFDPNSGGYGLDWQPWAFDVRDLAGHVTVPAMVLAFAAATTGGATFVSGDDGYGRFTDCSGLLDPLCRSTYGRVVPDLVGQTFEASLVGISMMFDFSTAGLTFGTDSGPSGFQIGALTYFGTPGFTALQASFSDVSIAVMPLPTGALLLFSGLAGLGLARRRAARVS